MQKVRIFCLTILVLLAFTTTGIQAQTTSQKQTIIQKYDLQKLKEIEETFKKQFLQNRIDLESRAKSLDYDLTITDLDGKVSVLQGITPDNVPIYYTTHNVAAARSTRTNHLNIGGTLGLNLEGDNMTLGVWDAGHGNVAHQEYDGAGGQNRYRLADSNQPTGTNAFFNLHAAHVAGSIMASGVNAGARGMASHCDIDAFDWANDLAEVTNAAANGLLISNHSYGFVADNTPAWYFGAYDFYSQAWDDIAFNAPFYLTVLSAGNLGTNNTVNSQPLNGNANFDKLGGFGTSKNTLVVANAQDVQVNGDGEIIGSIVINNSSSQGPTDDLRIKPDITGNGTTVRSTSTGTNNYITMTGTSMASSNVSGSLLLLQEHYNNTNGEFMRAATLKGLALHTADDAGMEGPDAIFGWGLMNAKRAAEVITNEANGDSWINQLTLNDGQTQSFTVTASGSEDLIASISWTDRPGTFVWNLNSDEAVLVNDLDIRITKNSTTSFPYALTDVDQNAQKDNTVDPYERIDIKNASGEYTITVTHKGTLVGGNQNFSLIVTGVTDDPPLENIALNKPTAQSSTSHGGVSSRAVDGNTSGSYQASSVTHTDMEQGWWRVDLGDVYDISEINVYNRTDCCSDRIVGANVYVGLIESTNPNDYTEIAPLQNLSVQSFSPNNVQGRYVFIRRTNVGIISLAEVEVFGALTPPPPPNENIALNKPTAQSSTSHGGVSSRAVDGNTSGSYQASSVTHTDMEQGWWRVDLGDVYDISEINVYNRTDCCSDRIVGANVYVGLIESTNPNDYTEIAPLQNLSVQSFSPNNVQGRYVFIRRTNVGIISLAEVEVFGALTPPPPPNENIALNKPTAQSSTSHGGVSSRAVDGNTSGSYQASSVTHTDMEQGWWRVDLGDVYDISEINVYNRTDCCSDRIVGANVYVGLIESTNPNDYTEIAPLQNLSVQSFSPNNVQGRYVFIKRTNTGVLSLAEVEVFGVPNFTYQSNLTVYGQGNTTDLENKISVKVYPNPLASDKLNINVKGAVPSYIYIVNLSLGRMVYENYFEEGVIDVSTLPSGLYSVNVRMADGDIITKKLVIRR